MTATALRRKAALAIAASAGTAFLLGSAMPAWADNVTLNNGDTKTYTPAQIQTGAGVTHRTAAGQPALSNSTEINFNPAASDAPTTSAQFLFNNTALDNISGLNATTLLETVAKLNITAGGAYTIFYNTDDGSRLYIDGQLIINNEGGHGDTRLSKIINLDAGLHDVRSLVMNNGGGGGLQLSYAGPDTAGGNTRVLVPTGALTQAENTAANAVSPIVSTTVRANNITPIGGAVLPDNLTLAAGATATINLAGSNYAIAGLGTLNAPAGTGLTVTGVVGAGADTRRNLTFTGGTTLGAGAFTLNTALDVNPGRISGATAATVINKSGAGRLILDNNSATPNVLAGTINVTGGGVYARGSNVAGATNPLGSATISLDTGTLQLDLEGNGTAGTAVTFDNKITTAAGGGTIQFLSGPGTYNLTSTTPIAVGAGGLTLNTFGGSNNSNGAVAVISAPFTGTGPLTKNTTPGSTAGTSTNIVGTAANRDTGQVILLGDSSGFSGPVTLATRTESGGLPAANVTIQPGILEGRASSATAKPFGTGPITMQGGSLLLRGTDAAATSYAFGNNLTLTANSTIDANLVAPGIANAVINMGALSLGANTLTANGGNGYSVVFTGTTLTGNPTFTINSAPVTLGPVNDGGTARTIVKGGGSTLIFNAAPTAGTFAAATSLLNVTGGSANATAAGALGSQLVTLTNNNSQVVLTANNSAARYVVNTNTILEGNTAGFTGLTRTGAAPSAAGQVQLSGSSVVAQQAPGQNAAFAASGALGTANDLLFGIGADQADSFTVSGTVTGQGPWRGFASDRSTRTLTGGTITANSNFEIKGMGVNIQLGAVTLTPANPVVGSVTLGRMNLGVGGTPNLGPKLTLAANNGGAIQFNIANALGSAATAAGNANAIAYQGGTLDPGVAGSLSGNVLLYTGSIFQFNDANNLGGLGTITAEPGAIIDYAGTTTQSANGNATQNVLNLPAGTIYRTNIASVAGFGDGTVTGTNPAGNYEVNGILAEDIRVSAGIPTRKGFVSGLVTNGNAAHTLTGTVVVGPGGATIAASSGGTLTLNSNISLSGPGSRSLIFGSNLIIDPTINGNPRNNTVVLGGTNTYGSGTDLVSSVLVRGRSNVTGNATGTGNLPQGAGVNLNLGGTYQVNGPLAGAAVAFGAVKANGGTLFLNRTASSTGGLIATLNAPIDRSGIFGAESRGSLTLMLTNGQVFGTSTDRVNFSSAANAPTRLTVVGTGGFQQIGMVAPWLIGTDSANPSNNSTFLNINAADVTTVGLIPSTYVPMPLQDGTGFEIADNTAATTLTGDVKVAALRTNNNISGAFTINPTSGGLLVRGAGAGVTIAPNLSFLTKEGVIGTVQVNQTTTITGKISGTAGLTKFGQGSLILSNAANDISGGDHRRSRSPTGRCQHRDRQPLRIQRHHQPLQRGDRQYGGHPGYQRAANNHRRRSRRRLRQQC